ALPRLRRARADVRPPPCPRRTGGATRGTDLERRGGGGGPHLGRLPGEEGPQDRMGRGCNGALEQRWDLERVRRCGGALRRSCARGGRRGRESQGRRAGGRGG